MSAGGHHNLSPRRPASTLAFLLPVGLDAGSRLSSAAALFGLLVLTVGAAIVRWTMSLPAMPPGVTVVCTSDSARVDASVAGPAWLAAVDEHGQMVRRLAGKVATGRAVFVATGLSPGTTYAFRVFAGAPEGGGALLFEKAARTRSAITLLGLDARGLTRRLWFRAQPPATARWRGSSDAFPVGPDGAAIPLARATTGPDTAVLELSLGPALSASLRFHGLPAPPPPGGIHLPELGVVTSPARTVGTGSASGPCTAADWILDDGPGVAAVHFKVDGGHDGSAAFVDCLARRFGVRTLLSLDLAEDPALAA